MRLLPLLLLLPLAACTKPGAEAPFPSEPRCPSLVDQALWQKNFDGCIAPFRADKEKKGFTMEQAEASCRCASNGIIYAQTCEELKAFPGSSEEAKNAYMQKVLDACKGYLPALKDKEIKAGS